MCNCISALDEILAAEGGLVVDQNLAHKLLKRSGYNVYHILDFQRYYRKLNINYIFLINIINFVNWHLN